MNSQTSTPESSVSDPLESPLPSWTLGPAKDTIACSAAISACEKAAQWEVALQLLGLSEEMRFDLIGFQVSTLPETNSSPLKIGKLPKRK